MASIATDWRVTIKVSVKIQQQFGDNGSVTSATGTAKRTNAKFLIAGVLQLITITVMLTRAIVNNLLTALSAYTSLIVNEFD